MGKPSTTSWQDSLQAFLISNPDLPEGSNADNAENQPERKTKAARLDIIYERKGRAGKPATIITGFDATTNDEEIEALAAAMKSSMGCGGSCRGGEILLQGDRREAALKALTAKGYKARII